jgi:hydrogenase maturation factor
MTVCIGIPMQVMENDECYALCTANGGQHRIDTMLIGM